MFIAGMLHVGDIIKEVNGIPVATPEQLMDIIRVAETEITFKIVPTIQDTNFKSQVLTYYSQTCFSDQLCLAIT